MQIPDYLRTHHIFAGGRWAALSGDKPHYEARLPGGQEGLLRMLGAMSVKHEPTTGKYGEPERSILTYNPTREQTIDLGKAFGRESVVFSQGGKHELIYVNGPHEGKSRLTHPSKEPMEFFTSPPDDYYTHLPGHGYFRINFDFDKEPEYQGPEPIKKADPPPAPVQEQPQPDEFRRLGSQFGQHDLGGLPAPQFGSKAGDLDGLVRKYGYKVKYVGGRYEPANHDLHNYETGHLLVKDPGDSIDAATWSTLRELSRALTEKDVNKLYGPGERDGKLGDRTLNDSLRAVHWEHLAHEKQRDLEGQLGMPSTDEDYHKRHNAIMAEAVHHAIKGFPADSKMTGFVGHPHEIPVSASLDAVRAEAERLGISGLHVKKAEAEPVIYIQRGKTVEKTYTPDEVAAALVKAAQDKILKLESDLADLRKREAAKVEPLCKECGKKHGLKKGCKAEKAELVDAKGDRSDNSTRPDSVLPEDKKVKDVPAEGSGGQTKKLARSLSDLHGEALKKAGGPPMPKPAAAPKAAAPAAPKAPTMKADHAVVFPKGQAHLAVPSAHSQRTLAGIRAKASQPAPTEAQKPVGQDTVSMRPTVASKPTQKAEPSAVIVHEKRPDAKAPKGADFKVEHGKKTTSYVKKPAEKPELDKGLMSDIVARQARDMGAPQPQANAPKQPLPKPDPSKFQNIAPTDTSPSGLELDAPKGLKAPPTAGTPAGRSPLMRRK